MQTPINADIHKAAQVDETFIAKNNFRRRAIQTEHADFHFVRLMLPGS